MQHLRTASTETVTRLVACLCRIRNAETKYVSFISYAATSTSTDLFKFPIMDGELIPFGLRLSAHCLKFQVKRLVRLWDFRHKNNSFIHELRGLYDPSGLFMGQQSCFFWHWCASEDHSICNRWKCMRGRESDWQLVSSWRKFAFCNCMSKNADIWVSRAHWVHESHEAGKTKWFAILCVSLWCHLGNGLGLLGVSGLPLAIWMSERLASKEDLNNGSRSHVKQSLSFKPNRKMTWFLNLELWREPWVIWKLKLQTWLELDSFALLLILKHLWSSLAPATCLCRSISCTNVHRALLTCCSSNIWDTCMTCIAFWMRQGPREPTECDCAVHAIQPNLDFLE